MRTGMKLLFAGALAAMTFLPVLVAQQIAVRGETVYTAAGAPIKDGVVIVTNGKIERVGPASSVKIPAGYQTLTAKVVTPGLVDAHSTVGLDGLSEHAVRPGSTGAQRGRAAGVARD